MNPSVVKNWWFLATLISLGAAFSALAVERYGVYEHTLTYTGATGSKWYTDIDVEVTAPGGAVHQFGAFWYENNTWKWRYSPRQTGTYTWRYRIDGGSWVTGSFNSTAGSRDPFVKRASSENERWEQGNDPYFIFGWQDCIEFSQFNFNEFGLNNWRQGGRQ